MSKLTGVDSKGVSIDSINPSNLKETIDDDAALAGLVRSPMDATRELTGKEVSTAESDRWRELGEVLVAELKIAAARTTVSSVPALLAEHLCRRLWKIDKKQAHAEGRELLEKSLRQYCPRMRADALIVAGQVGGIRKAPSAV